MVTSLSGTSILLFALNSFFFFSIFAPFFSFPTSLDLSSIKPKPNFYHPSGPALLMIPFSCNWDEKDYTTVRFIIQATGLIYGRGPLIELLIKLH